jgi:Excalibur calcium-binding domain/Protein of unknown function (DUF1524)
MGAGRTSEPHWYKQYDGRLRYWDGGSWTSYFADPANVSVGWYPQNDGLWAYWDGREWSVAAARPRPGDPATSPPRATSTYRLPLIAVGLSAVVAIAWLTFAGPHRDAASYGLPSAPASTDVQPHEAGSDPGGTAAPSPGTPLGQVADALARLPVKGRAAMTGYDRESFRFGSDTDGDGCETRDDVLARDLEQRVLRAADECITETGSLADPYSGRQVNFVRATSTVDVDHVVSLGNAWATGAFGWDDGVRVAFANDPLNLLAVDASLNRQKSDGDAATWLPRKSYRCDYVARQIAVKAKYRLWVTPPERSAMVGILGRCPDLTLPGNSKARPTRPVGTAEPLPVETGGAQAPPVTGPFANCDQARAAGAAPVHSGDPGYAPNLDRDHDGTGCDQ